MSKIVTFNNENNHRNMLFTHIGGKELLFEFKGENIPGVAALRSEEKEILDNSTEFIQWRVELSDAVYGFMWMQKNTDHPYLGSSWAETASLINSHSVDRSISIEAIKRYVRATWGLSEKSIIRN